MSETISELEQLYNQSVKIVKEGELVKGKIVSIGTKEVLVDVGFKSEGVVPLAQFQGQDLAPGKELDFLVDSVEDDAGMIILSRDKALRIQGWDKIVQNSKEDDLVEGTVTKKVKGGFLVEVMGIEGFLPASLSMFKGLPEKDIIYKQFMFKIVKVNNIRRSMIVSRREAIQKEREVNKERMLATLKAGEVSPGLIKAITDFGAFVDLGGIDGLLHITDMSWSKISHPSEIVALGDKIDVMVLNIDKESGKVSLGLKQRLPDPWTDIGTKYTAGSNVKGKVVNIVAYGVFLELEKGIEGLVHVSEISWTKRISNPKELFAIGDILEAQVLTVDKDSRRISLSIKKLEQNPWTEAESKYPVNSRVSGKVRGFTDYGVFVELDSSLEGMVHVSDISWTKKIIQPQDMFKKGQRIDVVVLSVDSNNRRISLGMKQLQPNPWADIAAKYPLNSVIDVVVLNITDVGVFVKVDEDVEGLIYSNDIEPQELSTIKVQEKIKVKVTKIDVDQAKIGLSLKI